MLQTGRLNPDDLDGFLLTDKTRLLAFPHCSNVVAHVNPVATKLRPRINAVGAIVLTLMGWLMRPMGCHDVEALGPWIFICFRFTKTWGPHQGLMTVISESCLPGSFE